MTVIPQHKQAMAPMKTPYDTSHQWTMFAGRSISQKRISLLILAFLTLAGSAFAQGTVSPVARQTWLDNNGAPAANYRLCTFQAGTSTLANTYTTAALNVANANPLVLDSAGRGTVFLTPGSTYKFLLKDSTTTTCVPDTGSTIWSVDQVSAVPASNVSVDVDGVAGETITAGQVVYLSDGSGGTNAGQWYLADADFTYKSTTPSIGIAPTAITSGATGSVRIQGRSTGLSGLSAGSAYYVSTSPGALTAIQPTNVRYVGQADSTTALVTTSNPPVTLTSSQVNQRIKSLANGRLSFSNGVAVPSTDVTAATTVYWVPYQGNEIGLYSGTEWVSFSLVQLSIAVPSTTATMYDVFMDYNAGTPALSLTAWTNDTTRATALTTQDGIYVLTGSTGKRYVGSFRTGSVSGQTEDSLTNRLLWNNQWRLPRALKRIDGTDSWNYTTATYRLANAPAANQVNVVIGLAETPVDLTLQANGTNGGTINIWSAIGYDSTTVPMNAPSQSVATNNIPSQLTTRVVHYPAVGYHYYAWLERSTASGTTVWYGDNGDATLIQSGLFGMVVQ